jgi:hypothetical protein
MRPFLVQAIGSTLAVGAWLSPLQWLISALERHRGQRLPKSTRAAWTEVWVLANVAAAIFALFLPAPRTFFSFALAAYGGLRVVQQASFQLYSQIYGGYPGMEPRLHYDVVSWRRSIFIALVLYFETMIWFGAIYRATARITDDQGLAVADPLQALYFSAITMLTVGYGDLSPASSLGYALVVAHCIVAFVLAILVLSRVVSYLPKPSTSDPAELP